MKLSDVTKRFTAPFSVHQIDWQPTEFRTEGTQAKMRALPGRYAIQDRLDAICPDDWSVGFTVPILSDGEVVIARLTVLGNVREGIGEVGKGQTIKHAMHLALTHAAAQFGIGRYLAHLPELWVEWDVDRKRPISAPELPAWAKPDHERSPGGAHLMRAMEQLQQKLPEDLDLQRTVYKHLKAALECLQVVPNAAQ
jgi:hypothetical protein